MDGMDIGGIVGALGYALAVATFFVGRRTAYFGEGKDAGSIVTDIQHIKQGVARIESKQDNLRSDVSTLQMELGITKAFVEKNRESLARAHRRIDAAAGKG